MRSTDTILAVLRHDKSAARLQRDVGHGDSETALLGAARDSDDSGRCRQRCTRSSALCGKREGTSERWHADLVGEWLVRCTSGVRTGPWRTTYLERCSSQGGSPGRGRYCRGHGHGRSSSRRWHRRCSAQSEPRHRSPRPWPSVTRHFTVAGCLSVAPEASSSVGRLGTSTFAIPGERAQEVLTRREDATRFQAMEVRSAQPAGQGFERIQRRLGDQVTVMTTLPRVCSVST